MMQRVLPIFQKHIFSYVCILTLFYASLYAAPVCSAVFSNAAGTTSGNLSANSGAKLYNTENNSNLLAVGGISGSTTICQGGTATCIKTDPASTMTLPTSPTSGNNSSLSINSNQNQIIAVNRTRQSATISGILNLNNDIYLNLKNNSGNAGDFTLNSGGTLNINGNVTIYAKDFNFNGTININSGSLTLVG
ncbi:MAG: hypothetical protein KBE79_01370, partial [Sulfurospirillum sp.]|nr:hypothetical protein [Sulfurospirillum sp.]